MKEIYHCIIIIFILLLGFPRTIVIVNDLSYDLILWYISGFVRELSSFRWRRGLSQGVIEEHITTKACLEMWVHVTTVLYRVSQKLVPWFQLPYNFWSEHCILLEIWYFYYYIIFLYSEMQYLACLLLFFETFCSHHGMEWDRSCGVEGRIFLKAYLSPLWDPSWSLQTISSIMLYRFSTGLISGEFEC